MEAEHRKTAFVFSGGASLGAIQVGMVRALYERGIQPDLIVGSSVGAINGAFLSSRPQTPATAEKLASVWLGLSRRQIFPPSLLAGVFGFFGAHDHLVSDRGLRELVEREIEFPVLEHAAVPLHVVATDLLSGRELRISRGDAVEAVMASSALPGVFPSVDWHGRRLIDGGVANNTPIAHAIELGAERIYVLPTGNACDLPDAPKGAVAMLLHAMSLLVMRRLIVDVEHLRDAAELIVLPPPCPLSIAPIDFSHTAELIDRGYGESDAYLDSLDAGEAPAPLPMTMHSHQHPVAA
jgi:NTE family protein